MPNIANDGTLVRGSIDLTINGVLYTLLNFKRDRAKSDSEIDYGSNGKPAAASHRENPEIITGTIRMRSDKVDPPKFTSFSYDSKNWYIKEREDSGEAAGFRTYDVEIWERINASVVVS